MYLEYFLLVVTNLIFQASRTYNTRAIAKEDTWRVIWTSVIVKISWIVSTAIGIKSMLEGDWILISTYVVTGVLGDYIGMRLNYDQISDIKN